LGLNGREFLISLLRSLNEKAALSIFSVLVSAHLLFGAQSEQRFVQLFQFPGTLESLVIAEGDLEPRSVGSYAVRVYEAHSEKFATDEFIAGIVRPRNGIIEAVRFDDIDGDNRPEIVVVIRAVGSGGYLSADGFRYSNRLLEWIGSVADLDKTADPVLALREKLKSRPSDQLPPDSQQPDRPS
jgi:hypothetical protein